MLVVAAALASLLGVAMFVLDRTSALASLPWIAPAAYFLLAVAHSGVRNGSANAITRPTAIRRMNSVPST